MTIKDYYSLTDISKILNIPASTLRYWKGHFMAWLPHQGEGRKMRYHADSMEIFKYIQQCFAKNMSVDDIKDELSDKYPMQHDVTTPYQPDSDIMPSATSDSISALQLMIESIMDKGIGKLADAIVNVQELKDENRELKQRLAKLESIVLKTQPQQLNNHKATKSKATKKKQVKIPLDKRIQKMRDDKVSWDKIADALNKDGLKNPNTGGKWNRKSVQKFMQG